MKMEKNKLLPVLRQFLSKLAFWNRAQKWICVEERLPEPETKVLLLVHGWGDGRFYYIGMLRFQKAEPTLWGIDTKPSDWTVYGWSYFKEPQVTHWMPLPDLPKGWSYDS